MNKEKNYDWLRSSYYLKPDDLEEFKDLTCSFIFPKDVKFELLEFGLKVTVPKLEPVIVRDDFYKDTITEDNARTICYQSSEILTALLNQFNESPSISESIQGTVYL